MANFILNLEILTMEPTLVSTAFRYEIWLIGKTVIYTTVNWGEDEQRGEDEQNWENVYYHFFHKKTLKIK